MKKKSNHRFLVIADKRTEEEGKQYSFFFQEKGTDQDIETLVQAFLEDVKKNDDTVQGWGAKRLLVFFKVYTERRHSVHIQGILDFTNADLAKELEDFRCTSFMKLWSDRYDGKGFPLLEKISAEETEDKKPIWRPISYLPLVAQGIEGYLSASKEQYGLLSQAKEKTASLDDDTVSRVIKSYTTQREYVGFYEEQLRRWRKQKLKPKQLIMVMHLEEQLAEVRELTEKVLELTDYLKDFTIEKILAMDPAELAMLHLSGKLKLPKKP